jgi:hypothetical protein
MIETYQLSLPGFEGRRIEVRASGFFTGYKLLLDGSPAPKGPRRGQMLLRRNDGTEILAAWKPMGLGLDVPQLQIEGTTISLVSPLRWYEWIWAGFPFVLLFIGGALGGLLGGVALAVNAKLFRSEFSTPTKYLFSGVVSAAAILTFLLIAVLFLSGGRK